MILKTTSVAVLTGDQTERIKTGQGIDLDGGSPDDFTSPRLAEASVGVHRTQGDQHRFAEAQMFRPVVTRSEAREERIREWSQEGRS